MLALLHLARHLVFHSLKPTEYYTLLKKIKAFLSNRTQMVTISNCISDKTFITSGLPQGSDFGRTHFLIFINNICDVVADLNVTM